MLKHLISASAVAVIAFTNSQVGASDRPLEEPVDATSRISKLNFVNNDAKCTYLKMGDDAKGISEEDLIAMGIVSASTPAHPKITIEIIFNEFVFGDESSIPGWSYISGAFTGNGLKNDSTIKPGEQILATSDALDHEVFQCIKALKMEILGKQVVPHNISGISDPFFIVKNATIEERARALEQNGKFEDASYVTSILEVEETFVKAERACEANNLALAKRYIERLAEQLKIKNERLRKLQEQLNKLQLDPNSNVITIINNRDEVQPVPPAVLNRIHRNVMSLKELIPHVTQGTAVITNIDDTLMISTPQGPREKVEGDIPDTFEKIRSTGAFIFGCSARGFGDREGVFGHLKEAGINLGVPSLPVNPYLIDENNEVGYENGVIFAPLYSELHNNVTKADAIVIFLQRNPQLNIKKVLFADDVKTNVDGVHNKLKQMGIASEVFHFEGAQAKSAANSKAAEKSYFGAAPMKKEEELMVRYNINEVEDLRMFHNVAESMGISLEELIKVRNKADFMGVSLEELLTLMGH